MKKLQSFIAILLLIVMVVSVDQVSASITDSITETSEDIFIHDQVVDVNIEIDVDTYDEMLENATDEEYVLADITYNGETYYNVAIRPKGNSSLRDVANSDSDRYSFKIDFDKYVDGQNMSGITKINLNNIFSDDTLMAEYISYEMLDELGAVASDTTFVALSINGEYSGLYLAVEEVNEVFLEENYGNSDGELYKPDMGTGSDLAYISDDVEDYNGINPQDDDMSTDETFVELVTVIDKIIENGGETEEYNLSDILNVDSFLAYLAMSTATVHLDAYQGSMYHNYYLYYNTDTELFEWISWDLNMTFNGFPQSGLTDEGATSFLIDEPVSGSMTSYPLVEAVFTNEEYVEVYHEYLDELINGYLSEDTFEATVLETYNMIESYASTDPSAFFSIDEVKTALFDEGDETSFSLLEFVAARVESIAGQLDGTIVSTNNGEGNASSGKMGGEGQAGGNRVKPGEDANTDGVEMPAGDNDIIAQIMELYENGEFSDELSEYIANDEMPPQDLLMEELEALGVEMPMMGNGPGEEMVEGEDNMRPEVAETGDEADRPVPDETGDEADRPVPDETGDEADRPVPDETGDEADRPVRDETGDEADKPARNETGEKATGDAAQASSGLATEDIIALVASFAIAGGLSLYLIIRKY